MTGPRRRRSSRSPVVDLDRVDLNVLAIRARDGDRDAEAAFIGRTMRDVWRFCAHVLDVRRADDAVQATYLRALRSLRNYRGDAAAKTWLIGVARNVCLDEMRSDSRQQRLITRLRAEPHHPVTGLDTHAPELVEALDTLSTDRKEAFVLTQLLGFTYEETAVIAGCPIGTVRSRAARARADLFVHLQDDSVATRSAAT